MEVKLTKAEGTAWLGNGMGNAPAVWRVKGTEITCSSGSDGWFASYPDGTYLIRPYGWTRKELLTMLSEKLADDEL